MYSTMSFISVHFEELNVDIGTSVVGNSQYSTRQLSTQINKV